MEAAESLEETKEGVGEEESGGREDGARLSVTQSDDPRSGGHFALGMSKTPLQIGVRIRGIMEWCENV